MIINKDDKRNKVMSKIINVSTVNSSIDLPDSTKKSIETKSNEVIVENMSGFKAIRTSEKTYAIPSQEVTQTLTLTNNSGEEVKNVIVTDTISAGATFKAGSVTVDSESMPDADPTIALVLESSIPNGSSVVISYVITVDAEPKVNEFTSTSQVTYDLDDRASLDTTSNTLTTTIVLQKLSVTKTSTKSAVIKGQTLTYQITVTNEGNIKNTDITLTDPLSSDVTFVQDSVKINEVTKEGYNPSSGFSLPDLNPTEKTVVMFDVSVN